MLKKAYLQWRKWATNSSDYGYEYRCIVVYSCRCTHLDRDIYDSVSVIQSKSEGYRLLSGRFI